MPRIYLCFLWHMHQPFYKDLLSGEYQLPWTRMHALKDYWGMVKILEEFPGIRQTFNLVPSMMVQIEEYASGRAHDPFLQLALKPAEALTSEEQAFILRHFFHANPHRMIYRYPRYGEIYNAWKLQRESGRTSGLLGPQEFRDLQVLSQLAWFDEEYHHHDLMVSGLVRKGRNFSAEDQAVMGAKQRELIGLVIPEYKKFAATGQIEISTTPFYHPILPLLCDSDIARVSHPGVPLPRRFQYAQDAREQLRMAREYCKTIFDVAPVGLWPSEGSVSDAAFTLAAEAGFEWAATDNGVLDRTLGQGAGIDRTYKTWEWNQNHSKIGVIFRDHLLSDLIGFVYSGMNARDAAFDFLRRIRENSQGILSGGRDALVPIILDGENAWEYYDQNGRPFLRELYSQILADHQMEAITVREGFERMKPAPLDHIFPGSWINANFDVWIGAEEDNRAWDFLGNARDAYEKATNVPEERRKLAYEELLIAEGSDWCWWYGPEHDTANREEFDAMFRGHIANVYRALGLTTPEDLSRPIARLDVAESQTSPTGPLRVKVDGTVSSYFEWLGAGIYRISGRSGAMHGKRFLIRQMHYGSDGEKVFLRFDFGPDTQDLISRLDLALCLRSTQQGSEQLYRLRLDGGVATVISEANGVECAFSNTLEVSAPLPRFGEDAEVQASFWQDGLPVDAVPMQGWLRIPVSDPDWVV